MAIEFLNFGIICVIISVCFFFGLFFHELGHFCCSRMLGIKVESLVIGIGPGLIQKNINDFQIRLKLFPIKAYLKTDNDVDTYFALPLFQKLFLSASGPASSLLAGSIILFFLFISSEAPLAPFFETIKSYGYVPGIPAVLYAFFDLIKTDYANIFLVLFIINFLVLSVSCLPIMEQDFGKMLFNIVYHNREDSLVAYISFSKVVKFVVYLCVLSLSVLDIYHVVM